MRADRRVIGRVIDQGEEHRTFQDDPGPQKKRAEELPTADKHLLEAFKRLRFMAERIDIPHAIRGRAEEIYKQLYETKQLNGRKQEVPHHRSPFLKRFLPALFLCQHFACATPGALVAH